MSAAEELAAVHAAAMRLAGLKNPERVSIHYDVFGGGEDGGPAFSVVAKIPDRDKRKVDHNVRATEDTLASALELFRARLESAGLLALDAAASR